MEASTKESGKMSRHGQGKMTYADGSVYEGEWNGYGMLKGSWDSDGRSRRWFVDGKRNGKEK